MEDILQFLVIAGVIAFGIFRQFNKEKPQKPEKRSPIPVPEYEYEPEFEETVLFEEPQKQVAVSPKLSLPQEGVRSTYTRAAQPKTNKEAKINKNEFSIQSAEEVRRAIVWSEILQRKY